MLQSLCVFCGSRTGSDPVYATVAAELGQALARHEILLVYGGGNIGIMGVLADAVLAGGGRVTGVIPESLLNRELAHSGVQDMRIVDSMHTRKALMAKLSQGFIALPGGLGTFEELCEILTWAQLGFHRKPIAILNINGYFDPLLAMLDQAVNEDFVSQQNRNLLRTAGSVTELLEPFLSASPEPLANSAPVRDLT